MTEAEAKTKWCKIGGRQTLVDDSDVSLVEAGGWWWNGRYFRSAWTYLHRYIARRTFGVLPSDRVVDHINRDQTDNRRCNLRLVRQSENLRNSNGKRTRKARYRGVFRTRSGKWTAQITVHGERRVLGTFPTEDAAGEAYRAAEQEHCGLAGKP